MEIVNKHLSELTPYENNPRLNDDAVDGVAESIKQFGFKVPMVIDANGVIVCGHTRYKAAKQLGLDAVPCVVADDLTDDQIKAFRLADNKVAEAARWDFESLDLELEDIDIDMSDFGFEIINGDDFNTEFELAPGEKDPIVTMSITLADDEAEVVKDAINKMKHMPVYAEYENPKNKNSNGKALFLVVKEWVQQRT